MMSFLLPDSARAAFAGLAAFAVLVAVLAADGVRAAAPDPALALTGAVSELVEAGLDLAPALEVVLVFVATRADSSGELVAALRPAR